MPPPLEIASMHCCCLAVPVVVFCCVHFNVESLHCRCCIAMPMKLLHCIGAPVVFFVVVVYFNLVGKCTSGQVYKCASVQVVGKCASVQVCKCINGAQVDKWCASVQVCKCASV